MRRSIALLALLAALTLTACAPAEPASQTTAAPLRTTAAPETTAVPETTAPAPEPEKSISAITTLDGERVVSREDFHYDEGSRLTRRVTTEYPENQEPHTHGVDYSYDDAGNLLSWGYQDSVRPDYEYHYDRGVLTGYTHYELFGDTVGSATTYRFVYDEAGNITGLTTDGDGQDFRTQGEYTCDDQGRRVFAYERERYGDHAFERTMIYDYTYKGAALMTREEVLPDWSSTTRAVVFGAPVPGFILGATLEEGSGLVTDDDGYITAVTDAEGRTVYTFEYVQVSAQSAGGTDPAALTFADIPESFTFASGAGAWATGLTIAGDGSFTGEYHDSEMGEQGDGYPNGTVYYCRFSGRFSQPEPVDEYTCRLTLEALELEDQEGSAYIENGIRYVAAGPNGLDGPREYFLYLPGIPVSQLPEAVYEWVSRLYMGQPQDGLYILCGANGEHPFVGSFR